jgi:hypothetical protein
MEVLSITNDGLLTLQLTEEEQRMLIEYAVNKILEEEIKKHEQLIQSPKPPSKYYDSVG